MSVEKKLISEYLRVVEKIEALMVQKEAIEAGFKAHVEETGEMVLCNLIKVSFAKSPPKLVYLDSTSVTTEVRNLLCLSLMETNYTKTSLSLEIKKIHENKDKDKVLKAALKLHKLTTEQTENLKFDRIVKSVKK